MAKDEKKRKWFEEITPHPTLSRARTRPLVVEKVKKKKGRKRGTIPNRGNDTNK
jgi:hypothetical protein